MNIIADAAPIITAAFDGTPYSHYVTFAYTGQTVRVTPTNPHSNPYGAFDALHDAFTAAGWGYRARLAAPDYSIREAIIFEHPSALTQVRRAL